MSLESATFISQLVPTNPTAGDPKSQGDDHLRLLKAVLQAQFPNLTAAAINATVAELNYVVGVTSGIQAQFAARALKAGDNYSGTHDFTGALEVKVPAPIANADAVTKQYADGLAISSSFPVSGPDNGKIITNNGVIAFWDDFELPANSPIAAPVVTGEKLKKVALAANNIDMSLGNWFTKTITGPTTLTVSGVPAAGTVGYFVLELINAGSNVTFWATPQTSQGNVYVGTASGRDKLGWTIADGTTWDLHIMGQAMA